MRIKFIVSLSLILSLVAAGCVKDHRYDNHVDHDQQQKEQIQELQATVSDLIDEIDSLENENTLSTRKARRLNRMVNHLNDRVKALDTSRDSLRNQKNARIRELQGTLRTLWKQNEKLNQMLSEVESQNLNQQERNDTLDQWIKELNKNNETLKRKLTDTRNEFSRYKNWEKIVRLEEQLYFERASAELNGSHRETLDGIIQDLSEYPDKLIVVVGHADTVPISKASYSSNWDLSAQRATRVVEYITTNSSYGPERFSVKGRGEYERAKAENRRTVNQDLDRRVEITLVPNR